MSKRKTKVTEETTSLVSNFGAWGLESRGVSLHVNATHIPEFSWCAIDIETDEKDNFVGIAICGDGHLGVYYYSQLRDDLKKALESFKLVGHNIKSDAQWLRKWGVNVNPENLVYDTMLASYVQDPTKQSHGLKELAHEILGVTRPSYSDIVGTGSTKVTLNKHPIVLVANYCGSDVFDTFKLYQYFLKVLTNWQQTYLETIEMPTMRALLLMEERGVTVNAEYLRTLDSRFNVEIQRLVENVRRLAPSVQNVNSDKQVGDFLISKGFTLPKTPKGKNSVSRSALEPFEGVPFIKTLGRYSELEKLVSTYTQPLIERGTGNAFYRLHANFNQAVTNTGRLSSSKPNLQNIPARTSTGNLLRGAFVAKPGYVFVDADYSQIEPRLFAHFSQDPELLRIFNEGLDLYDYIASVIGCERPVAKTVWLALSYNAGPFKIGQAAHISYTKAVMFIDKMKKRFKTAFQWKEGVIRDAETKGYVETLCGRRLLISEPMNGPNYLVQGSAAEIMKGALIATSKHSPVMTVHDELIFELESIYVGPGLLNNIKREMESVISLSVPLVVEVGEGVNWQEAKEAA